MLICAMLKETSVKLPSNESPDHDVKKLITWFNQTYLHEAFSIILKRVNI